MKIYYQYSSLDFITPTKGDFINEINTITALSKFSEVYFNGKKFSPGQKQLISPCKSLSLRDADFVWVRACQPIFNLAVTLKIPCSWMSSPYNEYAFKNAKFIACFSQRWTDILRNGEKNHLNPAGIAWKNAVNVRQTVSDHFTDQRGTIRTEKIRESFDANIVVGCFGRIVESNYPHLLIACIPELYKKYSGRIRFVFGCTNKGIIPDNLPGVIFSNYSYEEMPYVLSACDFTFTGATGAEWDFCGSLKLIEAAACGTPFICEVSKAREELTGSDYPYYLPANMVRAPISRSDKKAFMDMVSQIYVNGGKRNIIRNNMAKKAHQLYSVESQALLLEEIIKKAVYD